MPLNRRKFLMLMGGSSAAAVVFQACGIPERELEVQSPVKMPEDLVTGVDNWYATLCRQCSTSEGLIVRVMEGRAKKVEGNPDYPINTGKHGATCEAALQALYSPDRLSAPKKQSRGAGLFFDITWDEALDTLSGRLQELRSAGKANTVVLATSPLRGHVGMVMDKFAQAYGCDYLGYETLEHGVLRKAVKDIFNQDQIPDLDIANSRFILSFGADFLGTWVSPVRYARGYGEFRQGRPQRGKLVHVETRFSMTAANADQWVYIKPGTEGVLALSIAHAMISNGWGNAEAAKAMTGGQMAGYLDEFAPAKAESITGVSQNRIVEIAKEFAQNQPSMAIGGGSTAAHTNGLFNLKAILALNSLAGSVNQKGGIIFNPGPALADVPAKANVASFADWKALAERMRTGKPNPVNLLILRGINPIYGLPASVGFQDALKNVPMVATFSSFMDDTARLSDLVLPEHTALESWGDDVPDPGPSYKIVGFQQPVVRPFFEAKAAAGYGTRNFADVILSLAEEVGLSQALPWNTYKDVLMEGARKLYSAGGGSVKASSFAGFWNGVLQRGGWWDTSAKSQDKVPAAPALPSKATLPAFKGPTGGGSFYLMPFPSHTLLDGSNAHLPWLQATPDPITTATWQTWVEINTKVAESMGIREGDEIEVESPNGTIKALAYPHPAVSPDVVCVPIGQGHSDSGQFAKNRGANVLSILAPETDQETGALAWASTRVAIRKTGRWIRLPKLEGTVPAFETDKKVIEVTSKGAS